MSTIRLQNAIPMRDEWALDGPVDFELNDGEQIAIVGENGSGKSLLTDILCGKHPLKSGSLTFTFPEGASRYISDNVRNISFRDCYGGDTDSNYYMQQRWNQWDISDPRVTMSSGELRKYSMNTLLAANPSIIIIDNPYIGLDATSRVAMNQKLQEIARTKQLIIVLAREDEVPDWVSHVVTMQNRRVASKQTYAEWKGSRKEVIRFNHVSIRYGERTILKDLDWVVMEGEKWALMGPNGSGKSTVLSIVCADNPQSYACNLELFGRKRGTGESIWDIKKHIGYVSPELHRSFTGNYTAERVVAAGLNDYSGMYSDPSEQERATARMWMERFDVLQFAGRPFMTLSSGEQRMVLLARAFVKDPTLLILDEPFHGLDHRRRLLARRVIEDFCDIPGKTLIMVTHYPEELPACIDHKLVLEKH